MCVARAFPTTKESTSHGQSTSMALFSFALFIILWDLVTQVVCIPQERGPGEMRRIVS
jgi:hypothetical protein